MSLLLQTIRLRFGTPREIKPIGPQMDTALVTRNIMARSSHALLIAVISISPSLCLVSVLADFKAAKMPTAKSDKENSTSKVVTPSNLKLAAPHR